MFRHLAAPLVAIAFAAPAIAADPAVKAGATIHDTNGGVVGTIAEVNGDLVVVDTGSNKVSLPVSSFGSDAKGPVLALTKAQLDAAAEAAKAKAEAALKAMMVPGASVFGAGGAIVGTIDAVDADYVTLKVDGRPVKLPVDAFSRGDSGLMIALTADQLRQAVEAATPAEATADPVKN